jgi:RecA/RadA recombinase
LSTLNISNILAGLRSALTMGEQLVPEIAALTPYGAIATTVVNVVSAAVEVADSVVKHVEDGKLVMNSTDQAQVRAMAQQLHDLNDHIAEQIDAT